MDSLEERYLRQGLAHQKTGHCVQAYFGYRRDISLSCSDCSWSLHYTSKGYANESSSLVGVRGLGLEDFLSLYSEKLVLSRFERMLGA